MIASKLQMNHSQKKPRLYLKLSAAKIATENFENFSGSNSEEEIKGTVIGGEISVTVDAENGKIYFSFN